MSVSVSSLKDEYDRFSKVYVGTEASALWIKLPGEAESREIMSTFNKLESSKSWSFHPDLGPIMCIKLSRT